LRVREVPAGLQRDKNPEAKKSPANVPFAFTTVIYVLTAGNIGFRKRAAD
jgi:hypothetical protein